MKKILLIGKLGQVGWELERSLKGEIIAVDRTVIDLTHPNTITSTISKFQPQIIINAAAYTAVDQAEQEPEKANFINGTAVGILAEEAKKIGALLVHYSTDYVFDGTSSTPYIETSPVNPINNYGRSKLMGELAISQIDCRHLIFRTSWVYGMRGKNFLLTILRLAKEKPQLRIVHDQIGAPTWSRSIAKATSQILQCKEIPSGIYHLTSAGKTSWHGFAEEIVKKVPNSPQILGISTAEYPTPAKRPAYSVLSNHKLEATFGLKMPHWLDSLNECFSKDAR